VALRQVWAKWIDSPIIIKPKTVIGRIEGSRSTGQLHQTRIKIPVERKTQKEIRYLIYRMVGENRWGAPRIYSELLILGFNDISEATVSRYLRKY